MATTEIRLIKVYAINHQLRAKLKINKKVVTFQCGHHFPKKNNQPDLPNFMIVGISNKDPETYVTIETYPAKERITLTPTESQFI